MFLIRLPHLNQKRLPGLERLAALVQQAKTSPQLQMIVLHDIDSLDEHVTRARSWQAQAVQARLLLLLVLVFQFI